MPITGIDASKFQGKIDWAAMVQAGVKFAFLRAGDGIASGFFADLMFAYNRKIASFRKVPTGAYYYARFNISAQKQAEAFCKIIGKLQPGELPPVIDVEDEPGARTLNEVQRLQFLHNFVSIVESTLGVPVIIYTSKWFWDTYINSKDFSTRKLWLARYASAPGEIPGGWDKWTFWQSSESGSVGGVTPIDTNQFNGTLCELAFLQIK